ncbi:conserved exported hypothetical protein [uncultured Pleomorphomonas sp.]|uniref:Uncharacterized protein n=1 Tax=uncultured Pleomorphomonas sp. TaxID=442121 RepID=A0A212LQ08_9HYPH|nr:YsaB family lipoprotein [uncultured Pleomorphomonas sp.]SCM79596.1 conserved exported hypothetical protein [uncultured Pleomorphomonas sp.]
MTNDSETRISPNKAGRRAIYAAASLVLAAFWLAAPAEAKVPSFSAACPGRVDVRADNGGRVFINGQPARLKSFNDRSYEARAGNVTVSVAVGPGGRLTVSSAARGPGNGICQVKDVRAEAPRRPGNTPPGQLAAVCRDQAAQRFRLRPSDITTDNIVRRGAGYSVEGKFRDRGRTTFFRCSFDGNGRFVSVR